MTTMTTNNWLRESEYIWMYAEAIKASHFDWFISLNALHGRKLVKEREREMEEIRLIFSLQQYFFDVSQ